MIQPAERPDIQSNLARLAKEARAKQVLRKAEPRMYWYLILLVVPALSSVAISHSGFEAPLVVRVFLILGVVFGIVSAIDNFMLRRKLNAAIELLLLNDQRGN